MIDRQTFAGWMGTLGDRFNKPLEPATMKAYHVVLSQQLDTREFDLAAAIVFAKFEYKGSWPAPQVFVNAVLPKAPAGLDAGDVLSTVRQLIEVKGYAITTRRSYDALPDYIRRAVRAVGGIQAIHRSTEESEPFLLRDFAKALTMAKDHCDQCLTAGVPELATTDPMVLQLIAQTTKALPAPGGSRG